jgi:Domain of unknown function (DUF4832)/Domain of unknown function (DUF4874)
VLLVIQKENIYKVVKWISNTCYYNKKIWAMKNLKTSLIMKISSLTLLFTVLLSCKRTNSNGQNSTSTTTINYTEITTDFPNPERGFYRYSEVKASNFVSLNLNELKGYRNEQSLWSANYKVLSTLVFRYYVLDGFNSVPLTATLLNSIKADFQIARLAGVKLIPRFVYTVTANAGSCPEAFICPPYGDASKAVVINHIAQLKPIFTENTDVIACVQLGFIGTWGENYYTDFFGDPSGNAGTEKLLDNNWQDRIDVLQALLNAVPKDRMVQIRYPQFKQRFVYGVSANVSSQPLTEAEGFTETDKARIAFHNDCFLSGPNDVGTYEDYGNTSTPRSSSNIVVSSLRDYKKQDSKYVAVGGETCDDIFSPQNNCEPIGRAQTEMAEMHYSFLNAHYNTTVNNDWQSDGCMLPIKTRLGYRFVLKNITFPKKAVVGQPINIVINLNNIGYASPYNPRPVELLLRSTVSGFVRKFTFNTDIRRWFNGAIKLDESFTLPADMSPGDYEVLLNMPDKYPSINTRSEYAIRVANKDVWEDATGYNNLGYTLTVK